MIRWMVKADDSRDAEWIEVIDYNPANHKEGCIKVRYQPLGTRAAETAWDSDPEGNLLPVWQEEERVFAMSLFQYHHITMKLKRAGTEVPAP